ncbi:ABC transporter ATP-binding protein [Brevibacterium salitolerans]|uniref:ABC transporter ATP-binding protein n=1 Tax=Brevibacterium salitolerans TaxID=1403566 RepID=A0ABN2X8D6_9MICO
MNTGEDVSAGEKEGRRTTHGGPVSGRPASGMGRSGPLAGRHPGTHPGSRPGGHPGSRPGTHPGASAPLDPRVRDSTPRWVLGVSAGLGWLAAVSAAVVFLLVGRLLSAATAASGSGTASGALQPVAPSPGWWTLAVVAGILAAVSTGVSAWFTQWAASETERRLRVQVVSAVFRGGAVHASAQAGRLLSTASAAVEKAAQYRAAFLGPITASLTTPLLVLALMALTVDPVIAGVLALLILLVPLLIGGFQRLVRPVGGRYRRSQARLTAAFLDAVQALETLVHSRAADREAEKLARRGEEHRSSLMRMLAVNQLLILVVDAAFSLTVVVAAAVLSVLRVASGDMDLGQAVAVLLMSTLVIGPVDVVGQFFYIGIAGRASQSQIGGLLAAADSAAGGSGSAAGSGPAGAGPDDAGPAGTAPDDTDSDDADPVGSPNHAGTARDAWAEETSQAPVLLLEHVTAGWPGGPDVLTDFSLAVRRGERVALVGPSGAGKSTAAAVLEGHLTPRSGRVEVDGIALGETASAEALARARRRMAVVEQRAFLFMGSIRDNLRPAARRGLADGRAEPPDSLLWDALGRAGLRADVEAMSQGLDTPVGEQGALLSGGQAQRLAIARAWLTDAPILLLDEPTSQVDLGAEAAILDALDSLSEDRTVLMIAHRPGAILAADRVVTVGAQQDQSSGAQALSSGAQDRTGHTAAQTQETTP